MELRKHAIRTPTPFDQRKAKCRRGANASPWAVLRSQRPQTHLDTSCTENRETSSMSQKWGPAGKG